MEKTYDWDDIQSAGKGEEIMREIIKIAPFELIQLLECSFTHSLDEHGYLTFKGIVSEERQNDYRYQIDRNTRIQVVRERDGEKEMVLFDGYLQEFQIVNDNHVYYVEGKAADATVLLDLEKKKRSFQNPKNRYKEIIDDILSHYQNADVIDRLSNDQTTGGMLVQYDETDWAFICRLASHFGGHVISSEYREGPKLYFGFPFVYASRQLDPVRYKLSKNYEQIRTLEGNTGHSIHDAYYTRCQVKSNQFYRLGDYVLLHNQTFMVAKAEWKLEKGSLRGQYLLALPDGLKQQKIQNKLIKGSSMPGTVIAVRQDQVLVSLDIDKEYGEKAEYWFPYSTGYTSDNNVGWYMMPELEDRVRVHFPTENEAEAYALASVRDGEVAAALVPSIKTLKNKYGKTITLEPDQITISGNGTEIILNDDQGITIKSDKGIRINGKDSIMVHGKEILMDAKEQIKLSVGGNSITIDDQIVLNGTEVKMN